ncbi:MAG: hypothetical protein M0P69_05965 [Bacteroidales bacterium]|nr:hypothetical protein [Bacteroidales bacterium]
MKRQAGQENKIQDWYFTWGRDCYTVINGTYNEARKEMFRRHGQCWGFQYGSAEEAGVKLFNLREEF